MTEHTAPDIEGPIEPSAESVEAAVSLANGDEGNGPLAAAEGAVLDAHERAARCEVFLVGEDSTDTVRIEPDALEFLPYRKTAPAYALLMAEPFLVKTMEGQMDGRAGDWLMRGAHGEYYPCSAQVFADTYEPMESESLDWRVVSPPEPASTDTITAEAIVKWRDEIKAASSNRTWTAMESERLAKKVLEWADALPPEATPL